jgi:CHASE2 domain-containing sensor protein
MLRYLCFLLSFICALVASVTVLLTVWLVAWGMLYGNSLARILAEPESNVGLFNLYVLVGAVGIGVAAFLTGRRLTLKEPEANSGK